MLPLLLALLLAACTAPSPRTPLAGHLAAPLPEQATLPEVEAVSAPPVPTAPERHFSVTVRKVPAEDLLFALARDAEIDISIDPDVEGTITLNALKQPLPEILERIAGQLPIRFEYTGKGSLHVKRDTPYMRHYPLNYVNLERRVSAAVANTMQIGAGQQGTANTGSQSSTRIENTSHHRLWERIEQHLLGLLGTEKGEGVGNVIIDPEAGLISVQATEKQHRKIAGYLRALDNAIRRQVLIEATIVEVALSDGHEQGVDWSGLVRTGLFEFAGNPLKNAVNLRYNRNDNPQALISLLERFGTTRVLSSPRLSVLNNQTALLKVVENYVYFTVKADTTSTANVGSTVTYTTTPQTVSVGLVMGVTPQISSERDIILNIRPTITSVGREVADPNPDLRKNGIENLVPMIRTREIESVMRLHHGQIAVLGGLMEDQINYQTQRLPLLGEIPLAGELVSNRNNQTRKTELVIFLRPIIIVEPSLRSDYAGLREQLPKQEHFDVSDRAPPLRARHFPP
ncbi:MAG: general secretion pathway protein GspD [Azonexus sp.]|nr:general secretion pathway protein GspD [Azonexus sp.]